MATTSVFIRHTTQSGKRDRVRSVWERHMASAVKANSAHEAYFYCFDNNNPDIIVVYQQYASAEAAAEFLKTPAYLAYLHEVEPLLLGQPEVTNATPIWIK